jgi:hypothetical protein
MGPGEQLTVADLIKELQKFPMDGKLEMRDISVVTKDGADRPKLILIVHDHEMDPVFQFTGPFERGFRSKP